MKQNPELGKYVNDKLQMKWSPDQISVSLRKQYPNNKLMQISHETIYLYIYLHTKKELREMLIKELRQQRKYRGNVRRGSDKRTTITDAVRIDERPEEVAGVKSQDIGKVISFSAKTEPVRSEHWLKEPPRQLFWFISKQGIRKL